MVYHIYVTRSKQESSQTKNHIILFILTHRILYFKTHKNTLSYKLQEKFKSTELKRRLKWLTALAAPPLNLGSIPSTHQHRSWRSSVTLFQGVLCPLVISEGIRTQVVHRHILRQNNHPHIRFLNQKEDRNKGTTSTQQIPSHWSAFTKHIYS